MTQGGPGAEGCQWRWVVTRQEDAQIGARLRRIEELLVRPNLGNLEETQGELAEVLRIFETSETPTVSAQNRVSIRRIGLLLGQAGRLRFGVGQDALCYQSTGLAEPAGVGSGWQVEA